MGPALGVISTIATIGGTVLGAVSSIQQGKYQDAVAQAQAKAEERKANEVQAASQRDAAARAKEAKYVMSRQQAVAAASGGGAGDSTILNLMAQTGAQGQYNANSSIYEGQVQGGDLKYQAGIDRMSGRMQRQAGYIGAGTTLLGGIADFAKYKYGY